MQVFEHMELNTTDLDGAKSFYGTVFGWTFESFPMGHGGMYWMPKAPGADRPFGGFMEKPMPEAPTQWLGYITVGKVKETTDKVKAAGGKIVVDYMVVDKMGAFAVCIDPQGASFAVWESHAPPPPTKSPAKGSAKGSAKKSAKKAGSKKNAAKKADKKAPSKKADKQSKKADKKSKKQAKKADKKSKKAAKDAAKKSKKAANKATKKSKKKGAKKKG